MTTKAVAKVLAGLLAALVLGACALVAGGPNPVAEAGPQDTVKIEVVELNTWDPGAEPYVPRLLITDRDVVDELVASLGHRLKRTLKVACIPEYELRFHLANDAVEIFRYSCHDADFLRGSQEFWQGEDYRPPQRFQEAFEELLGAGGPSHVNVTAEAGLERATCILVFETVTQTVTAGSEGQSTVVTGRVVHRLTVADPETIARVARVLDVDMELGPSAQVAKSIVLEFHLDDGTARSVGYGPGGSGDGVIHVGALTVFKHRDAQVPAGFEALMQELLDQGAKAP